MDNNAKATKILEESRELSQWDRLHLLRAIMEDALTDPEARPECDDDYEKDDDDYETEDMYDSMQSMYEQIGYYLSNRT